MFILFRSFFKKIGDFMDKYYIGKYIKIQDEKLYENYEILLVFLWFMLWVLNVRTMFNRGWI